MKPEEIDEALQLLAPIVSHELRNPMAVIKNSSYFIKTKLGNLGVRDEKVARHLSIIESELTHANDVLEEILLYCRMKEPKLAPHSLRQIVNTARAGVALPDGTLIESEYADGGARVEADPELAVKALAHLIRNAVQAASLDEDAEIRIETAADGSVRVADTAGGVPQEALARLFEPFNTTKPKGIGLGLAYVKKALGKMGASVSLEPGEETVFSIRFKKA